MSEKNYYDVLGVCNDVSNSELKKAYRRLAKKYHPDVNKDKGAEDKFKAIQKAYDTLKDKEKRNLYDSYGNNWEQASQNGFGNGSSGFSGGGFDTGDLGDIFGSFFGGGNAGDGFHQQCSIKGKNLETSLNITIIEAMEGCKKNIRLSYQQGHSLKEINVVANIPKNIGNGKKIKLTGKGSKGKGSNAPAGDLLVKINVTNTQNYTIEANNIYEHIEITPWDAILGASIEIGTPFGKKKIKVPANTRKSGKKMRIKGKGLAGADFFIVYEIVLPSINEEKDKEFYTKMKEEIGS